MKIFIWTCNRLTDRYHSSGGLVVIAETIERAREMMKNYQHDGIIVADADCFTESPEYATGTEATEEQFFVFPDAGCC